MHSDDCACLTWKEVLSIIDGYYNENDTFIFVNFILAKSLYLYIIRFGLIERVAHAQIMELVDNHQDGKHEAARDAWEEVVHHQARDALCKQENITSN